MPDNCELCRRVWYVLRTYHRARQHHPAADMGPLTMAEIARRAEIAERTARLHVSHLCGHGRLLPDRRTPVAGATVGAPPVPQAPTPLQWVACQQVPTKSIGKILGVLAADGKWSGQMSQQEIAQRAGVSLRTVERAKPTIEKFGWVRFEPRSKRSGPAGEWVGREANFYELTPEPEVVASLEAERARQMDAAVPKVTGGSWDHDRLAAELLSEVHWVNAAHGDRPKILVTLVDRMSKHGWPPDELLHRLRGVPHDECVDSPAALVASRLPAKRYSPSAARAAGERGPLWVTCKGGYCAEVPVRGVGGRCASCAPAQEVPTYADEPPF